MTIEELRQRQAEIRSRLKEIDGEHRGDQLPEAERSEWNELNEEFEANETRLAELVGREERLAELDGDESRTEPANVPAPRRRDTRSEDLWDLSTVRSSVASPEEATREMQDRALRVIDSFEPAHEGADVDAARSTLERMVRNDGGRNRRAADVARQILETGSPTYRRAFGKALAGVERTPEEARALSLAASGGGYAVPFQLDPTIIPTSNGVVNPIRQLARVESITVDTWKGVASEGITASYKKEGAEAGDNAPELSQPEVSAERADAFVPYSIEIGQDWGALEAEMAKLIQDAKDTLEATKFLTGDGEDEPYGILTGATEVVSTATKEAFAVADLYSLKGALPPRFKPRAAWLANDAIYDRVRQFDTGGGANLWVQLAADRPAELLGKAAYELSTMDSKVNAEEKLIAILGDFNYYLIAERLGMTVELVPHLFGENQRPTGQRGLFAVWRNGAKVLSKKAFRVLKVKKE